MAALYRPLADIPLTLPSPPVGERVAQGRRGAAEPYSELGEGVRQIQRTGG
jgi:hypothetical protein